MRLSEGTSSFFADVVRQVTLQSNASAHGHYGWLPDGAVYLQWPNLFEFLVSADGLHITGRQLAPDFGEAFQTYLLGQMLSHCLLKQGIEPLHATVLQRNGRAFGLIGDSGYGKSTLAAAFIQAGYQLLTDDLLVLRAKSGHWLAYPGLPRLKLFPEIAAALLGNRASGSPMNNLTPKLIIPVAENDYCSTPTLLTALYALIPPGETVTGISIEPLSQQQAFVELLKNTYVTRVTESERLKQQFDFGSQLAVTLPVKRLLYPKQLSALPSVREAISADIT